jgi:hypothetical protein
MSLLWDIGATVFKLVQVLLYGPAQKEISSWPLSAKKDLGSVLTLLQKDESVGLPDVRPMPSVGRGVSQKLKPLKFA